LKLSEAAQIFSLEKLLINFNKNGLGDFSTNSSGRPGCQQPKKRALTGKACRFSLEVKFWTQRLVTAWASPSGGRYMLCEKHVHRSRRSSFLKNRDS
jgi:hypothetical protein